ncbi:hypothetical protein BKA64DRAFT_670181 [Cadophora sp. MPI-SDFR-AT-0126]|nr:hypothetical protein BKA64DRAFT_670181 [Leotiomycetes sp. MPI-SDFR-AT-0126]
MDEYTEILYKKASSSLPNWPKGQNDFYVAILSHDKHVRSCEHKDLLWLKVRGKHTVGQVRAFHNKRVGRKVLLYDGKSIVPDDIQIRYLNHHPGGEVVVFWTKLDDGRAPLVDLPAAATNSRPINETSSMTSMRADHITRVRAVNRPDNAAPASPTSQQAPPNSEGQDPLGPIFAICQTKYPGLESDILKAFRNYAFGDIDCGECEAIFEQISSPHDNRIPFQHVLDHMLGPSTQQDSGSHSHESSDTESDSDFVAQKPALSKPASRTAHPPAKASSWPQIQDSLAELKVRFPTSSFSMLRNELNEECFTCHDCSRMLSSGAHVINFEQHLKSVVHQRSVNRKGW